MKSPRPSQLTVVLALVLFASLMASAGEETTGTPPEGDEEEEHGEEGPGEHGAPELPGKM